MAEPVRKRLYTDTEQLTEDSKNIWSYNWNHQWNGHYLTGAFLLQNECCQKFMNWVELNAAFARCGSVKDQLQNLLLPFCLNVYSRFPCLAFIRINISFLKWICSVMLVKSIVIRKRHLFKESVVNGWHKGTWIPFILAKPDWRSVMVTCFAVRWIRMFVNRSLSNWEIKVKASCVWSLRISSDWEAVERTLT